MPISQLKRAEKGLAAMREKKSPPEIPDTIEELVAALRAVERRLAILEDKGRSIMSQDRD